MRSAIIGDDELLKLTLVAIDGHEKGQADDDQGSQADQYRPEKGHPRPGQGLCLVLLDKEQPGQGRAGIYRTVSRMRSPLCLYSKFAGPSPVFMMVLAESPSPSISRIFYFSYRPGSGAPESARLYRSKRPNAHIFP